jgi:hypothetical protein
MAVSGTTVWEVNKSAYASDSLNAGAFDPSTSGAGTDFSITTPIAFTDLVAVTTTTVSSASIGFTGAHIGNYLLIASGTGWTASSTPYRITAVSAGVATVDSAIATASSTGGTGRLGGPKATPGPIGTLCATGNTCYIKYNASDRNYDCSSSANVSGGRLELNLNQHNSTNWIGYDTTRTLNNTDVNRPQLRAGANSITVMYFNRAGIVSNLDFGKVASQTSVTGFSDGNSNGAAVLRRSTATSLATGFVISNNLNPSRQLLALTCATGISIGSFHALLWDSAAIGSTSIGVSVAGQYCRLRRVAAINGTGSATGFSFGANYSSLDMCLAYGNAGSGFSWGTAYQTIMRDCISVNNAGWGYLATGALTSASYLVRCAGYGNTLGHYHSNVSVPLDEYITLTANPYDDAGSLDFTPNATSGLGDGVLFDIPGLTGTALQDIGPYQSQPSAGSTTSYFAF